MCGRYVLAMRPSQVRRHLEAQRMSVWDAPADEGEGAPRQSYNFAPGYHGIVYRADTPDTGAPRDLEQGPVHGQDSQKQDQKEQHPEGHVEPQTQGQKEEVKYKLQSMRWGLIPFWTKRKPDYASVMRTINCRDDSLAGTGGMWSSMKARKRCVVVAEGFYEWLKVGPKDKVPHYIKRKDGELMLLAGLWDCVHYEDAEEKLYTYTIITTDSNQQLKFLHDRMPVILESDSAKLRTWLDPGRHEWSHELQSVLRPFDGELEVYPVDKAVGKVGNNSPSFVVPVNSRENKSNIANFFAKASSSSSLKKPGGESSTIEKHGPAKEQMGAWTPEKTAGSVKRKASSPPSVPPTQKKAAHEAIPPSPAKQPPVKLKISATSNGTKSPSKPKGPGAGSQKITSFFAKNPA